MQQMHSLDKGGNRQKSCYTIYIGADKRGDFFTYWYLYYFRHNNTRCAHERNMEGDADQILD